MTELLKISVLFGYDGRFADGSLDIATHRPESTVRTLTNVLCRSCLRAIRMLQKNGHIPSDPSLFKAYAEYGHFVDVRVAALEAVVDYTRGLPFHFQPLSVQSKHANVRIVASN